MQGIQPCLPRLQQPGTVRPVMLASSSNYSEWTLTTSGPLKCGNLVKCRTQVRWDPYLTSWSSISIWTLPPPQNRTSVKSRSFLNRGNDRMRKLLNRSPEDSGHWQTFYDLVNVYVFDIGSICFHGKELFRQFTFHQKYREKSHSKADVRDIWTVDSRNNQMRF